MDYEKMWFDLKQRVKQQDDMFTTLETYGTPNEFISGKISGLEFALDEMRYIEFLEKERGKNEDH